MNSSFELNFLRASIYALDFESNIKSPLPSRMLRFHNTLEQGRKAEKNVRNIMSALFMGKLIVLIM
jgi:hypothetical protein